MRTVDYVSGDHVRVVRKGEYEGREYVVDEVIEGDDGGHVDHDYEGWRVVGVRVKPRLRIAALLFPLAAFMVWLMWVLRRFS